MHNLESSLILEKKPVFISGTKWRCKINIVYFFKIGWFSCNGYWFFSVSFDKVESCNKSSDAEYFRDFLYFSRM